MTPNGTDRYRGLEGLPPPVTAAVELARRFEFGNSCIPEYGRLLQVLARGKMGGVIGETGTGCGVGLAWMLSAVDESTRLVSVELDEHRAVAVTDLFRSYPNVTIVKGDWHDILRRGPFDLFYLDGGGKRAEDLAEPRELLKPGGTLVMDDFTPSDTWPPTFQGRIDTDKLHWLEHPDLRAMEFQTTGESTAIVGNLR